MSANPAPPVPKDGPRLDGEDDYIPEAGLLALEAFWAIMPEEFDVTSMQAHPRSVTVTIKFGVDGGPEAQADAMERMMQCYTVIGAVIRNLRWERTHRARREANV